MNAPYLVVSRGRSFWVETAAPSQVTATLQAFEEGCYRDARCYDATGGEWPIVAAALKRDPTMIDRALPWRRLPINVRLGPRVDADLPEAVKQLRDVLESDSGFSNDLPEPLSEMLSQFEGARSTADLIAIASRHVGGPLADRNTRRAGQSPFWPSHLIDLAFRPTRFFQSRFALDTRLRVVLLTWLMGMSAVVDRLDSRIMQAEVGNRPERWSALELFIGTWPRMWLTLLAFGAISGLLHWWIAGWWCRIRLEWSDASAPDPRLARILLIYSSLVYSGPAMLAVVGQNLLYPSYLHAYRAESMFSLMVLVATVWSIVTMYKGALALFDVSPEWARLWFIVLPLAFYALVTGGVAILHVMAGGGGG